MVLGDVAPAVMADLAHGVTGAAMVEAAAYMRRKLRFWRGVL